MKALRTHQGLVSRLIQSTNFLFLIVGGVGFGGCGLKTINGTSLSPDTQVTASPGPGDSQPTGGTGTSGNVYTTQAKTVTSGVTSGQTSLTVSPDSGYVLSSVIVDLGTDFQTTNVCTSKTVFGRAGAAVCQNTSGGTNATAANVLTGTYFWDSAGSSTQGTMSNLAALNITQAFPGAGYVSSITGLSASNVCSSSNLLGSAGTAVCQSGTTSNAATAADMISGKEAWNGSGAKLTGTLTNQGTLDASITFPGAGYYNSTVSNAPGASSVCSGTTVFGAVGSATCGGILLNSNAYRDQATTAITQGAETSTYAGAALPAGYRDVPVISKDDDGYVSAGVTSPQITLVSRGSFANCGTTQNTIAGRISDCASVNGVNATWDGSVKANAGQGTWKLVTRSAANKEVWQDQRTGLLWSSVLSTDYWCRAAGNAESGDPYNYCNNVTYQPSYPIAQSWCAEVGPTTMAEAAGSGETWSSGTYHAAKGGMGKISSSSSPSVRWRLPTIYDYEQANINGIRFVMPEMVTTGSSWEWSTSVLASNRQLAWASHGANTAVNYAVRSNSYSVRCVGR